METTEKSNMDTEDDIVTAPKPDITKDTVVEIEGATNEQYVDIKEKPTGEIVEVELRTLKKNKNEDVKRMSSRARDAKSRCSAWCDQNCGPGEIDYDIPVIMTEREKELRKTLPDPTLEPMEVVCPRCEREITTTQVDSSGLASCLLCILICLFGGWCCCIIPFYIKRLMNKNHFCPHCDAFIGQYRRLNCA